MDIPTVEVPKPHSGGRALVMPSGTFYFSNGTLVAFKRKDVSVRISTSYLDGSTARHMKELGVLGFPHMEPKAFNAMLEEM